MKTKFESSRGKPTANSRWLLKRELKYFMILPVWLIGHRSLWNTCFLPLHGTILKFWKSNGSLWLTQYLALTSRIIVLWVGGETFKASDGTVRVRLTRSGLPVILPGPLRVIFHLLRGEDSAYALRIIRLTLTLLSVYRVIGCAPIVKLSTIVDSFSGQSPTLEIFEVRHAVSLLPLTLALGRVLWTHLSESAGPNFNKATWSCGLDALAFLRHPLVWYHWLAIAYSQKAWVALGWNLFTILVSLPIVPLLVLGGKFPGRLGRLVKLFEARGKVRIVAITDWWTQILLSPLHQGIFRILKRIPQDGTFDQLGPVHRLMSYVRAANAPVFSYDLSAATDRLPVAFQVQVLEALGVSWARSWAALLVERPWMLGDQPIKYSVGQPMGALSSWAMLAISHHIVVQVASQRAGNQGWFSQYALLGDDIVIADEAVAGAYLKLMETLGVPINLSKSFEMKSGTLEFAKRWFSPHMGDISPMGPGLILAAVRNPKMLGTLIQDCLNRDFVFSSRLVRDLVRFLRIIRPGSAWSNKYLKPILSTVLGPTGGLWGTASGLYFKASWIAMFPHRMTEKLTHLTELLFRGMAVSQSPPLAGSVQVERLVSSYWDRARLLGTGLYGWISAPLVLCSPAFWVYYDLAIEGDAKLELYQKRIREYRYQYTMMLHDMIRPSMSREDVPVLSVRSMALELIQDTFESRLLDWNRKKAELALVQHTRLFPEWNIHFKQETEREFIRAFRARCRLQNEYLEWPLPSPPELSLVSQGSSLSYRRPRRADARVAGNRSNSPRGL